jgi:cold shock CspA family protein
MKFGTVKSWLGGYGFIKPDWPGDRDVFLHASQLAGSDPSEGDRVSYEIGSHKGRVCAEKVEVLS